MAMGEKKRNLEFGNLLAKVEEVSGDCSWNLTKICCS